MQKNYFDKKRQLMIAELLRETSLLSHILSYSTSNVDYYSQYLIWQNPYCLHKVLVSKFIR